MALNIKPRRSSSASTATAVGEEKKPEAETAEQPAASTTAARGRRSPRSRTAKAQPEVRTTKAEPEDEESESTARRSTSGRGRARKEQREDSTAPEDKQSAPSRRRRRTAEPADTETAGEANLAGAPSAELDRQRRTIERLTRDVDELKRLQRELIEKVDGGRPGAVLQRVGVFVDVANVELATDKLSRRLDWAKVLKKLTKDRQLVRAVAYSPVHEDINVSLESQRFTEPFIDRGYRLVTKPLKKFSDGTVKANVDIEMTVEILEMLDRLDVVCLVSGDGDFEPLVRTVQSKGVRVEIVSIGNATAMALKRAGDKFIDLASILGEVAV